MEKTVSEKALIQRINRRLAREGEKLRKNSNPRHFMDVGWHYVVDVRSGYFEARINNLEQYGREVGALGTNERLAEVQS